METRGRGLPNYLMSFISSSIWVYFCILLPAKDISLYTMVTSVWELPARHLLPGAYFRYLSLVPAVTTRDGILERQLLSRFLGINSSLLRCEFLSGFLPSFFLSTKRCSQRDSSFLFRGFFCMHFKTRAESGFV